MNDVKMKSMKNYGLFAVILFIPALLSAQVSVPQPMKTIDISEFAEIEVIPNKISLRIELKERTELKNEIKISIKAQEDSLRNLVKRMKIDASKLSVISMSTTYTQIRKKEKDAITHKVFDLELTQFSDVNLFMQKLDKWMVYGAYITKIEHNQYDSLMREMQKNALIKAKKTAQFILEGINESLANTLEVRFEMLNYGNDMPYYGVRVGTKDKIQTNFDASYESDEEISNIELKKIKIKSVVFVKFQIK